MWKSNICVEGGGGVAAAGGASSTASGPMAHPFILQAFLCTVAYVPLPLHHLANFYTFLQPRLKSSLLCVFPGSLIAQIILSSEFP